MASTKKAKCKVSPPDRLVVVTQRFYADDVEKLQAFGVAARMPWGEVLRRLVHAAIPRATVTTEGNISLAIGRIR